MFLEQINCVPTMELMPASELGYVPWTKKVCANEKAYDEGISNCDKAAKLPATTAIR